MPNPANQETTSMLKKPLVLTGVGILLVAIYIVWILLSRQIANQAYQERIRAEQERKQRESDLGAIEQLGGSKLAIQMLYATPEIRRGETAQVCFGVANAKSVTLEPQENPVWPSHNLCVNVSPKKTTTYILTATASDGQSVSQQVSVRVR